MHLVYHNKTPYTAYVTNSTLYPEEAFLTLAPAEQAFHRD